MASRRNRGTDNLPQASIRRKEDISNLMEPRLPSSIKVSMEVTRNNRLRATRNSPTAHHLPSKHRTANNHTMVNRLPNNTVLLLPSTAHLRRSSTECLLNNMAPLHRNNTGLRLHNTTDLLRLNNTPRLRPASDMARRSTSTTTPMGTRKLFAQP